MTARTRLYVATMAVVALPVFGAEARSLTPLYSFIDRADGGLPEAGPTLIAGDLFGTTNQGGDGNYGTVFEVNPQSGAETTIYSFKSGADGANPETGVVYKGDWLYGATYSGGGAGCMVIGCGTVFKINPKTGMETVLHSFTGLSDGSNPWSSILYKGGMLYGTTAGGGSSSHGVVFKIDPKTGAETAIYSFQGGTDGSYPFGLIFRGGTLYGTTYNGGAGAGTIFALSPVTGVETVAYSFKGGTDGQAAVGLVYKAGNLFGATSEGGASGYGTVFKFNLKTGIESPLYSFNGTTDGQGPGVLSYWAGNLIGTCRGGASSFGNLFKVNVATGIETVLHIFTDQDDGGYPNGALIDEAGTIYGTTNGGGAPGYGTVFKLSP